MGHFAIHVKPYIVCQSNLWLAGPFYMQQFFVPDYYIPTV